MRTQSRRSARLSLLSSALGPPTPSPTCECAPPSCRLHWVRPPPHPHASVAPPGFRGGGGHTRLRKLRERGWVDPIRTRGQTLWYSRYSIIPLGIRRSSVQSVSAINVRDLLSFFVVILRVFHNSKTITERRTFHDFFNKKDVV